MGLPEVPCPIGCRGLVVSSCQNRYWPIMIGLLVCRRAGPSGPPGSSASRTVATPASWPARPGGRLQGLLLGGIHPALEGPPRLLLVDSLATDMEPALPLPAGDSSPLARGPFMLSGRTDDHHRLPTTTSRSRRTVANLQSPPNPPRRRVVASTANRPGGTVAYGQTTAFNKRPTDPHPPCLFGRCPVYGRSQGVTGGQNHHFRPGSAAGIATRPVPAALSECGPSRPAAALP